MRPNDNNGETLSMKRMLDLKNAIWQFDSNTISRLVKDGAYIDIKDDTGSTLLHWAAQENKVAVMEYLLLQRTIDINHKNNQGKTALHVAAFYGSAVAVECLLRHGAQIDIQDRWECPPLHWALWSKCLDTITALLNGQANVNIKNAAGETALHIATYYGVENAVRLCLQRDASKINSTDNAGYTPLHWAAIKGFDPIIEILLAKGAEPKLKDKAGKTYQDLLQVRWSQQPVYILGQFAAPRAKGQPTDPNQSVDPSLLFMSKRKYSV